MINKQQNNLINDINININTAFMAVFNYIKSGNYLRKPNFLIKFS